MARRDFWSRDWFVALVFSLVFALLAFAVFGDGFQSLERRTYDLGVRARERAPAERITVVAIDEQSITRLGRWPWPRELQARLIDTLAKGGAKVIAGTALYLEAEQSAGSARLRALASRLRESPLVRQIPAEIETFGLMLRDAAGTSAQLAGVAQAYADSALARDYRRLMAELTDALSAAAGSGDETLAAALRAHGGVQLPMVFALGRPQGRPDAPLPEFVRRNALTRIHDRVGARADGDLPLPARAALLPLEALGAAAAGVGHLNAVPDVDGAVRFEPLVLQYVDEFYPSLSLMIAAAALNLRAQDIELRLGEGIAMGGVTIGTDPALRMYTHFYTGSDGQPPFPVDSAYEVLTGKLPPAKYMDKIVLVGTTAAGSGESFATPVSASTAPVLTLAHTVSSLLQGDFFTRPAWTGWAEFALFALIALYLAFALPRLKATVAAVLTLAVAVTLIATEIGLMATSAVWLKLTVASVFLLAGHALMTVRQFNITERRRHTSEAEGAESGHGAAFRDVPQKHDRAAKLSDTLILDAADAGAHPGGQLVPDAPQRVATPMLGGYQLEQELGKGAMGVVYLGKDPKLGRQVAIKTMALSQAFEPDELAGVKERFFREAQTAGRLTHPNIVAIYDAGEERNLAYIAMEFIRGHDLRRYTRPDGLLPVSEVLRLLADAADALDYAHATGIVHRDIKPANLMLVESSRTIKLMDFGIARITDSSKTRTGMVLGTPSYMSPEQLAGQRVDGRSDLFSLGVTLYQLLSGALPFRADSMVDLMLKITHEPHAPLSLLRPDLPSALSDIVETALRKNAGERYQRGAELARELRATMATAGAA